MFTRSLIEPSRKQAGHRNRRTTARGSRLETLEPRTLLTTGVLVLPDTPSPPTFGATVHVSEFGNTLDTTSDFNTSGGNFNGTFNGSPLSATYCLNLTLGIDAPDTFENANETTDGTIYGTPVPNAGAISWLIQNVGPTVTTPDQEAALQAAIWRTEYGPGGFQVNSVDNADTDDTNGEEAIIRPYYQSYLQALGHNTAAVSQVDWISPRSDAFGMDQGLVALPSGYTPAQIRTAYEINNITFNGNPGDGTGQTIAIVDAYDDPTIFGDLDLFDNQFGTTTDGPTLYNQYGAASSFLTVVNQNGAASPLPPTDPGNLYSGPGGWEGEEALDVEWAHAIAPGAHIILVECNASDLYVGAKTAATLPNVSVVSMSWGSNEFPLETADDLTDFTPTQVGHPGVTFVASSGDRGSFDGSYPAFSPNVVAVGGTQLKLNADNTYSTEIGWGSAALSNEPAFGGSGGGTSVYEAEPAYQQGFQSTGKRTIPDVAFDADPSTGFVVVDTYLTSNLYSEAGGTSAAAPCWAGLIAIANQIRVAQGHGTLNGATETLPALYALPASDFHDIVAGSIGGFNAGPGYDEVTGRGTPIANLLVPDLAAYGLASQLNLTSPPAANLTVGTPFNLVVSAEDPFGQVDSAFNGIVTLTDPPGSAATPFVSTSGALSGTLSVKAVKGVARFTGLTYTAAGAGFTIQAHSSGLSTAQSVPLNVHVNSPPPPPVTVTSLQTTTVLVKTGKGKRAKTKKETGLLVQFSGALSGTGNPGAYRLFTGKTKRGVTTYNKQVSVTVFSATPTTVVLVPAGNLSKSLPEQLRITPADLIDPFGRPLNGGQSFDLTFGKKVVTSVRVKNLIRTSKRIPQ
jgi:hypothetical protein